MPEEEDEDPEAADEEDLEQEVFNLSQGQGQDDQWDEEDEYEQEGGYEEYGDWEEGDEDDFGSVSELRDAYAAGWKAKQKAAEKKKQRGHGPPGSAKGRGKKGGGKQRPPDNRSTEDRKRNSRCAACGQIGHWRSDPICPKQGGTGSAASSAASGANFTGVANTGNQPAAAAPARNLEEKPRVSRVNWTYMVGRDDDLDGWERVRAYDSSSSMSDDSDSDGRRDPEPLVYSTKPKEEKASRKSKYKVDIRKVISRLWS